MSAEAKEPQAQQLPPPQQQDLPGQIQEMPPEPPPPAYYPPAQPQPLQPGYTQAPAAYPPPQHQQQYPPPHAQQTTVVVTHQPGGAGYVSSAVTRYGDHPVPVECTYCRHRVTTVVVQEKGTMVWLMVGIICLLGFWLGCCLIPLCIPSLNDSIHSCPNCKSVVGTCRKM
ncbi:uncharacterized protein [Amphiura filiformis]|uniref:uncharacterized protein n=1 Tax=Amphiura filiformis TaxID=82378 RepID=UPI003B21F056